MSIYTTNERNSLILCVCFIITAVICDLLDNDAAAFAMATAGSIWGAAFTIAVAIREAAA